ncbi:helix-turn-helix domain-containing protein [Kitasatospora sp. YST-16]|uniref:helix-turn-helix transcriptional regulator n=1 Tax=Kitasatospora sp. YST-16 TaxID=2998080 RepID=UPI002285343B|nr:helix-turn-helix domain-containing protein [Kitasatospora sp. YST-16]WAL71483.1 helix-turn-helix domain-containing protein [Kitasatospora sp. YST-16]WNW37523.1 helix-turn-helix domain-containing protein [Streptomyces sp. Li-HN-5-13]
MSGIFQQIESHTRKIFGNEPVCVHVGNVKDCDIKRHPTYPNFRAEAILAGVRSAPSSRLWESLIAMGRLGDLDGDDTWRLVVLDCITPCFRSLSSRIARDFRVEREEIRSAMVATALEVWASSATGVPPRLVRDRMVKAAFEVAFQRGRTGSPEHMTDQIDALTPPEAPVVDCSLRASSIIDISRIRNTEVAEQIRGERLGALLHGLGCFDAVQGFHEDMRAGRRSGSISPAVKASGLSRSRFSNSNLYYYASDLYPAFIGLREAAGVIGLPESTAYRLIRAGQFPLPVARAGRSYKVSVRALMQFTDIPDAIVHADDIENGARHARGAVQ